MKDMGRMGMFLFLIASVAGVLLAVTEHITNPRIIENRRRQLEQAQKEVLPAAAIFAPHELTDEGSTLEYTAGFTESGELAGVVLNVAPVGYGGPIHMVLGMSENGKLTGIKTLSHQETPGLGSKVQDAEYLNAVLKISNSKAKPIFLLKNDGGDIDAITAATVSSRAFCNGLRQGQKIFERLESELSTLQPPTVEMATDSNDLGENQ